jgi:hypothetical protein
MPVWPCGTRILGLLQPYVFKLKFEFEKISMSKKKNEKRSRSELRKNTCTSLTG